jgi:hypothetical protein
MNMFQIHKKIKKLKKSRKFKEWKDVTNKLILKNLIDLKLEKLMLRSYVLELKVVMKLKEISTIIKLEV